MVSLCLGSYSGAVTESVFTPSRSLRPGMEPRSAGLAHSD